MRRNADALIQVKALIWEIWRPAQTFTLIWIRPPSGKAIAVRAYAAKLCCRMRPMTGASERVGRCAVSELTAIVLTDPIGLRCS
jgi:hypothetical protein